MQLTVNVLVYPEDKKLKSEIIITSSKTLGAIVKYDEYKNYNELDLNLLNLLSAFDLEYLNLLVSEKLKDFPEYAKFKFGKYFNVQNINIDYTVDEKTILSFKNATKKYDPNNKKIEQVVSKPDIPVRKEMTKLSKLSDSEVNAIRNLKDDGVPLQEIINRYNIDCKTKNLSAFLIRRNAVITKPLQPTKVTEVADQNLYPLLERNQEFIAFSKSAKDIIEAISLLQQGYPISRVAKFLNVTKEQIAPIALRNKLKRFATLLNMSIEIV